jgi:exodeoxyribonuclease V beta subunit
MEENGYFLQASIYAMALKKYLALFEKRALDETLFGGAIYFFLRGMKPYVFQPCAEEEVICLQS